jgi:nucleotidyltransferase-like protein
MTVGDVAAQMPRGSELGVRKSLGRLVDQGIVRATEMGRNKVHELNREHVAAPIADLLADLRLELWRRIRGKVGIWNPKPTFACVFGSAARADGDSDSDIDLLFVRAPFPGDRDPRRHRPDPHDQLAAISTELLSTQMTKRQMDKWHRQVDDLHLHVRAWCGNPLQALEMTTFEWADHRRVRSVLYQEISRDAITIAGDLQLPARRTDRED